METVALIILFIVLPLLSLAISIVLNVAIAVVAVKAWKRRTPRWLAIVPALYYGGYCAVWLYNGLQILQLQWDYQRTNSVEALRFDPATQSLILPWITSFNESRLAFVAAYNIPEAYEPVPGQVAGLSRLTVRSIAQCAEMKQAGQAGHGIDRQWGATNGPALPKGLCVWEEPAAAIPGEPIEITWQAGPFSKNGTPVIEQTWKASRKGIGAATFKTARASLLSPIPFFFAGCGFISQPAGISCEASFLQFGIGIDGIPSNVDRSRFDDPIAIMLGIPKYSANEIQTLVSR